MCVCVCVCVCVCMCMCVCVCVCVFDGDRPTDRGRETKNVCEYSPVKKSGDG